jgi:hypothetical protein
MLPNDRLGSKLGVGSMSGLPETGQGWAIEQRCRPTRRTGLGVLEIIRGRVGLALDCRSGPGPRTARCRARSSSDQGGSKTQPSLIWIAVGIGVMKW